MKREEEILPAADLQLSDDPQNMDLHEFLQLLDQEQTPPFLNLSSSSDLQASDRPSFMPDRLHEFYPSSSSIMNTQYAVSSQYGFLNHPSSSSSLAHQIASFHSPPYPLPPSPLGFHSPPPPSSPSIPLYSFPPSPPHSQLPTCPHLLPSLSPSLPAFAPPDPVDRFDALLSASPASSDGDDDCSSQEKVDVLHALQASISTLDNAEVKTSGKAEEEHKEESPQADSKTREKLGRAKKPKKERGPKFAIRTHSDIDIIDDGFKWRKYGQKAVKNSPYPRSYYKCTDKQCGVKKHVERQADEPSYVVTTYEGMHNHAGPAPVQVIHRPISNLPQTYPFPLPYQMDLFGAFSQSSYYPMPPALQLQDISETSRDQGLLEDMISGEVRRRSI